jgi:BirA family biotin operon repressor/biotin-[acetyl-CoA-carboxylase] ligase
VIGIGINVNQSEFPESIADTATSLRIAGGRLLDRQQTAAGILRALDGWSRKLESGFSDIVAAAEERSYLRGRRVEMRSGTESIRGVADTLDENGALRVIDSNGECIIISSGEVTVSGIGAI